MLCTMETYDALPTLIGSKAAAAILGIDKTTLSRLVKADAVPIVTQLDGPNGALVFDSVEVERVRERRSKSKETSK